MNNEKVLRLVNRIEADFKKLAKETGENYLSACIIGNTFMLHSVSDANGQTKIDFFRQEA